MRRLALGSVLVGLGTFVIAIGLLCRYYAYPHLAVLPLDNYAVTESRAENATYFDAATLTERHGRTMVAKHTIRGDVRAGSDKVVVWDSFDHTYDAAGGDISFNESRVALDRRTSSTVNCCGQHIDNDKKLRRSGLLFQWPFYTQKASYSYFDETLRKPLPIHYEHTDELYGVTVYRFVQRVGPVQIGTLDLPGVLVGEPNTKVVTTTRWYHVVRTFWVEPRTGVIVKAADQRRQTLRNPAGNTVITLVDANMVLSDRDTRRFTKQAGDGSVLIAWMHTAAPWLGFGLGLLLIAAGAALVVQRRRQPEVVHSELDEPTVPIPTG